jgi:hypothetical protein
MRNDVHVVIAFRAKTPIWGRGLSLFLGENMHDFGILWEKGSKI